MLNYDGEPSKHQYVGLVTVSMFLDVHSSHIVAISIVKLTLGYS